VQRVFEMFLKITLTLTLPSKRKLKQL